MLPQFCTAPEDMEGGGKSENDGKLVGGLAGKCGSCHVTAKSCIAFSAL